MESEICCDVLQTNVQLLFINHFYCQLNLNHLHAMKYRRGLIQPLSRYVASSSGWMSWSFDTLVRRPVHWGYRSFVSAPLSWAYSKLTSGSYGTDSSRPRSSDQLVTELPDEHYVIVDLVKVHINILMLIIQCSFSTIVAVTGT